MKKLNHDERVELAKSRISKTQGKEKRRLSLRQRKIASLVGTSIIGLGAAAGISAAIVLEANKDKTLTYPIDPDSFTASDFVYKHDNFTPNIQAEQIGSQKVIYASQGPVRFVSNYSTLYDEEKMTDWLNWFYHDVSWGPEIATLSAISFLSGVQAEAGKVTLGYHTTSRDASTIIISPDVQVSLSKDSHKSQSLAYAMLKNPELKKAFPMLSDELGYRKLTSGTYQGDLVPNSLRHLNFQEEILNVLDGKLGYISPEPAYQTGTDFANQPIINYPLSFVDSITQITDPNNPNKKYMRYWDLYNATLTHWDDATTTNLDKINALSLLGFNLSKTPWEGIFNKGAQTTMPSGYVGYKDVYGKNIAMKMDRVNAFYNGFVKTDLFKMCVANHIFTPSLIEGTQEYINYMKQTRNAKEIDNLIIMSKDRSNSSYYHLSTLKESITYDNNKTLITKVLGEILGLANPKKYPTHSGKMNAILAIAKFYLHNNSIGSGMPVNKKLLGQTIFENLYKQLNNMSSSSIDAISASKLYEWFHPSSVDGYPMHNFNSQKELLVQLSKYLQEKYHSGEITINNGVKERKPGIPAWKQNDSFYDSIVRRVSQDMMYTVSHEYGHHTTTFHSQDLAAYQGHASVGKNSDATGTGSDPAIVPVVEVMSKPSLTTIGSGYKYSLFRNAFGSSIYKSVLDETTDGDSSTDISAQIYKDNINIDFRTTIPAPTEELEFYETGIESFNYRVPNILPSYFGHTKSGFGIQDLGLITENQVFKMIKNEQDAADITHDEVVPPHPDNIFEKTMPNILSALNSQQFTDLKTTNDAAGMQAFFKKYMIKDYLFRQITSAKIGPEPNGLVWPGNAFLQAIHDNIKEEGLQAGILTLDDLDIIDEAFNTIYEVTPDKPDGLLLPLGLATPKDTWADPWTPELDPTSENEYKTQRAINDPKIMANVDKFKTDQPNKYKKLIDILYKNWSIMSSFLSWDAPEALITSSRGLESEIYSLFQISGAHDLMTFIIDNIISKIEFNSGTNAFEAKSTATYPADYELISAEKYTWYIIDKAQKQLQALHTADPEIHGLTKITGEMFTRALYKDVGASTKKVFEELFKLDSNSHSNSYTVDGQKTVASDDMSIKEKFHVYHILYKFLRAAAAQAHSVDEFKTTLGEATKKFYYDGEIYTMDLTSEYIDKIADALHLNEDFHGGGLFPMGNNEHSPSAVIYVFNTHDDMVKYKTLFSTVMAGATPPASFYRYTSYYVESLTRALNQIGFNLYPELVPSDNEYLFGDRSRFLSMGVQLYKNDKATTAPDGSTLPANYHITDQGLAVRDMYAKYFNMDKTLSAVVRNYQSGLYSFFGWANKVNEYKNLVFKDKSGNIVAKTKITYNVDNFHYYTDFMHPETSYKLTYRDEHGAEVQRVSWMTDFTPLGKWKNTLLNPGEYTVALEKADGTLEDITNKDVLNNGQMNANGKTDETAEVVGNPNNQGVSELFEIKVSEILI